MEVANEVLGVIDPAATRRGHPRIRPPVQWLPAAPSPTCATTAAQVITAANVSEIRARFDHVIVSNLLPS